MESDDGTVFLNCDDKGRLENLSSDVNAEFLDIYYLSGGDIQGAHNGKNPISAKDPKSYRKSSMHAYSIKTVSGNPVEIKIIEKRFKYDPALGYVSFWRDLTLKVTYDDKINPVYLVIEQSGMIPTITDLIFDSPDPLYAALEAKGLLAVNNPTKIEFYDNQGQLTQPATMISYQYNYENLSIIGISKIDNISTIVKFHYSTKFVHSIFILVPPMLS